MACSFYSYRWKTRRGLSRRTSPSLLSRRTSPSFHRRSRVARRAVAGFLASRLFRRKKRIILRSRGLSLLSCGPGHLVASAPEYPKRTQPVPRLPIFARARTNFLSQCGHLRWGGPIRLQPWRRDIHRPPRKNNVLICTCVGGEGGDRAITCPMAASAVPTPHVFRRNPWTSGLPTASFGGLILERLAANALRLWPWQLCPVRFS